MSIIFEKKYTYDDVALQPAFSNVDSRLDPKTDSWLTKTIKIGIPIVNAPMDSVISFKLADILLDYGGIPIFNRFTDINRYKEVYGRYQSNAVVSTCVNNLDEIKQIVDLGFDKILLDTANGWTRRMLNCISELKKYKPDIAIIGGNVCSSQGTLDLINAGADAIRVGIGGGAACSTRIKTAVGCPQFSAVFDCAGEAKRFKIPIIADGAIRGPREVCLALAAGATTVMIGKLFATTLESAAEKTFIDEATGLREYVLDHFVDCNKQVWLRLDKKIDCKYRGQASLDFQLDHYGGIKEGTIPEGVDYLAQITGPVDDLIDELLAGLRSSMTYLGAKTIKEYQQKATFVEVMPSYADESRPRP